MTAWWWSWLLTAIGVSGLWLAGSQRVAGWYVCLAGQALWTTYAIVTRQWGFLAAALVYGALYARNLRRWHREAQTDAAAEAGSVQWACGAYEPDPPPGHLPYHCNADYGHPGDHRAVLDGNELARWPRAVAE